MTSIFLIEYVYLHNIFLLFLHIFILVIDLIVKEGILKDNDISLETLEVGLENTTLLLLHGYNAFAMCGALNVDVYNSKKMKDRHVICFRAVGVKTLEDLYEAKIEQCSNYANELEIFKGMRVKDAFKKLSKK